MRGPAARYCGVLWSAGTLAAGTLVGGTLVPGHLAAQERILSYDSEIRILPEGGMEVAERITVRAEGSQIRRGIYRDFPTRYRDRYGNRVRVDFEVLGVERDGVPEPWFSEGRPNGVRLNTGSDDFLPLPGTYTFTLRYRTSRQLGFFADQDELYWNAIGTGWIFPIEAGTVEVRLPAPVPIESMSAEGYTGPQGATGTAYLADLPEPGVARYRLTAPLRPYEGFTIVLTFPKGVIPEPTRAERARWLLADNRGILVALGGLIALLLFTVRRWAAIGRDPPPGIVIARYEPAPGLTPAGARFLRRMGYDPRCFSGDLLALAVAGHLHITREKGFLKDEWTLHRGPAAGGSSAATKADPSDPGGNGLAPPERKLLGGLFAGGRSEVALKKANAVHLSAVRQAHEKALDDHFRPRYFKRNGGSVALAALIAAASIGLAFVVSGGFGIPGIVLLTILMVLVLPIFALLVRAPTPEGRALLDEIEGLRLYLSVAERADLARIEPPGAAAPALDAGRFEALLPFAVALEVEEAWTKKFTAAVGVEAAAAATSRIAWYHGPGGISNLTSLTQSLGSSLSSQIAAASSPPGSSSGSGGGGSSGGGGGGGGGGGR